MDIRELRCEYQVDPLAIGVRRPRLSWKLGCGAQTAYHIAAESDGRPLWESGRVDSDQSIQVLYGGPPLRSRQRVSWRVRIWDENGQAGPFSAPARWEMGLLKREDWIGKWIGSTLAGDQETGAPCPFLRRTFTLETMPVAARLHITALGLYDASLNGTAAGDDVFSPGWTDYRTRLVYRAYDIKPLLRIGENVLGVILGDGWYCGHVAWAPRRVYGDRPRLLAQIDLEFEDGTIRIIPTGAGWRTAAGPILESDLIMGERYDARREFKGWDQADFDDSSWAGASIYPDPGLDLAAPQAPPVRRMQSLRPVEPPRRLDGSWIYDLGQNMTGRVRMTVEGAAGVRVKLRHAEVLDASGRLYTENLRKARATDEYTLKGGGRETYEPRFTFHGFRHVEVSGLPEASAPPEIEGIVLHSDAPMTGTFACSDPLINQLQRNIQWSQKGNFLDIPTDCPQRDERLGWTGDAQVFIGTAVFNMDAAAFYAKWLDDMASSQSPQGHIPQVVPNPDPAYYDGGPGWADAFLICPWTIYAHFGDKELLRRLYPSLKKFIDDLDARHPDGIRERPDISAWSRPDPPRIEAVLGFGDWIAPDGSVDRHGGTPLDLIGTAYFHYSARLLASIAGVLGRKRDATRYARLAEKVRRAFRRRFITRDGLLAGQTQTAYVLTLHFDLAPEEFRPALVDALVRDIERRGGRLATGFLGTPHLLPVLTRFGRTDVAYRLLNQKAWPSWLYPVLHGATTIWERWDGWTEEKGFQNPAMNSFNHYAYGAVGEWLYAVVAGIEIDPEKPAYKRIHFRPRPGGGLTSARAEMESPYGRIVSAWTIDGELFSWEIVVPPNTTACVHPPGVAEATEVRPGRHHFQIAWIGKEPEDV